MEQPIKTVALTAALLSAAVFAYDSFSPRQKGAVNEYWDTTGYVDPVLSEAAGVMSGGLDTEIGRSAATTETLDHCAKTVDDSEPVATRRSPPTGGAIILR